jgi:hypothetical protein
VVAAPAAPALDPSAIAGTRPPGREPIEVSPACVEVGSHFAGVFIANATDPGQKSVLEQERTKIVRSTAETCTTQAWSPDAIACFRATKTQPEITACEQKFLPARAPPAPAAPPIGGENVPVIREKPATPRNTP